MKDLDIIHTTATSDDIVTRMQGLCNDAVPQHTPAASAGPQMGAAVPSAGQPAPLAANAVGAFAHRPQTLAAPTTAATPALQGRQTSLLNLLSTDLGITESVGNGQTQLQHLASISLKLDETNSLLRKLIGVMELGAQVRPPLLP